MNARTIVLAIGMTALAAGAGIAEQQPPTPALPPRSEGPVTAPAPQVLTAVQPPRRIGQPVNITIDVTISDQRGGTTALKKTVSVVTGDRLSGFIRSTAEYRGDIGAVPLNVDSEPELLSDGKIRVGVNLQYDLPGGTAQGAEAATGPLRRTQIRENLAVILESGKPLLVAQSADPVGDRQVTVEIKATVLR
jgi:hypothetical protein